MAATPLSVPFSPILLSVFSGQPSGALRPHPPPYIPVHVSVLWVTQGLISRDSDPVFGPGLLPDSVFFVALVVDHASCPEALIASGRGVSCDTRATNGRLTGLSALPPTFQKASISLESLYTAFCVHPKDPGCLVIYLHQPFVLWR